jgi:hypothetical protein
VAWLVFQEADQVQPAGERDDLAAGVLSALGFEIVNTRDRDPSSSS